MVLRKTKPHLSTANGGKNDEIRVEVVQRKSTEPVDHWAFLDEIEAPMWADLTLEANSTHQDNDDEWFCISHPFHQCSSRQLISAFSHSGEGCTNSEFGIEGPSSPKLPPSVSRSRGKHYKSREWARGNHGVTLNKRHPVKNLSSKSSWMSSGAGREIKPRPSKGNKKGHAGSKAGSVCESSLTESAGPNNSKPTSSFGDLKPHSSSIATEGSKSDSTSTITSESSEQQQQKSLELSGQIFGHTSGLLSALRISLRRSCVTRQASRVEINGGRQSEGCKSSSSKSSVGSSSNPGYDVKNLTLTTMQNKEKTPDSRNVMRMSQAPTNKVKVPNVSKAPVVHVQDMASNSKWRSKPIASKSINQESTKAKVRYHSVHAKVLLPHRVNEQDSLTAATKAKDKSGVVPFNRLAGGGKENAIGRMAMSQKSSTREKAARGVVQVQKVTKWNVPQKSDRIKLAGPKEKINGRSEGEKYTNVVKKVYLR